MSAPTQDVPGDGAPVDAEGEDVDLRRAADVELALRARFPAPAWALLFGVSNGTGARRGRTADAVAMSLWPSRGLEIHGIEIKVSRGDWLRELKAPEKAEVVAGYCDRWWIAVGDKGVVRRDELPPTWGLLVPRGPGMRVEVDAPKLEPKALDRAFVASMFRRASEGHQAVASAALDRVRRKGEEHGRMLERANHERVAPQAERDLAALRERAAAFETASGVSLAGWAWGPIGEAVRLVLEARSEAWVVRATAKRARETADHLDALISELRLGKE